MRSRVFGMRIVLVAGETVSYERIAQEVEGVLGKKLTREAVARWDVPRNIGTPWGAANVGFAGRLPLQITVAPT